MTCWSEGQGVLCMNSLLKINVFVKHYAPYNKVQKAIFSTHVKVKVIDLGFIWKGISLVEYACQIWSLYLL